jgi:hypothetical protein
MILIDFLGLILLYTIHKMLPQKENDAFGNMLFLILAGFGVVFLFLDMIDKIKGLF